jgi:hypothetical protein
MKHSLDRFCKQFSRKTFRKWWKKTSTTGKWIVSERLSNGKPSVLGVRFDSYADARNFLTSCKTSTNVTFEAANWAHADKLMLSRASDDDKFYVAWRIGDNPWNEIQCQNEEQSDYLFISKANELDEYDFYQIVRMRASLADCGLEQVTCSMGRDLVK